jgi:hypothetical protein
VCLVGVLGLFALFPDNPLEGASRFYQDFRGRPIDRGFFKLTGHQSQIKEEAEGLRITLPAQGAKPMPTGLVANFRVAGDFEITTSYELLKADQTADGSGVGVQLYIVMESPT